MPGYLVPRESGSVVATRWETGGRFSEHKFIHGLQAASVPPKQSEQLYSMFLNLIRSDPGKTGRSDRARGTRKRCKASEGMVLTLCDSVDLASAAGLGRTAPRWRFGVRGSFDCVWRWLQGEVAAIAAKRGRHTACECYALS
jgi:hypothetical protein